MYEYDLEVGYAAEQLFRHGIDGRGSLSFEA